MKTLSVLVDDRFVDIIDKVVKDSHIYRSRSEFIKDAIREKTIELDDTNRKLTFEKFRKATRKLALKAMAAGWDGKMPTRKQREKIAGDFLKEKGFK